MVIEAQSSPATLRALSTGVRVMVILSAAWWGGRKKARSSPATPQETADGGAGDGDHVGGLVGFQSCLEPVITASYGFGTVIGETDRMLGNPPMGVSSANNLTAEGSTAAGSQWLGDNSPWKFGSSSQPPVLAFITGASVAADKTTVTYACTDPPETAFLPAIEITCGTTLLPGQGPVSPVYMWVEGNTYAGDLRREEMGTKMGTGLEGAHAKCTMAASGKGLPGSRTYTHKAVLGSASDGHPRDLPIPNQENRELQRPDGTKIADKYADFFDPSPLVTLTNKVSDTGISALSGGDDTYWTGLLQNGNVDTGNHCTNWTSTTGNGSYGGF